MIKVSPGQPTVTEVDITPDRSLIPKLGKGGYTLAQALGELVDNSLDARVVSNMLHVALELTDRRITVADDGSGMTAEQLAAAMRVAYRAPARKPTLGEFGIGMKAACMALGARFWIVTQPKDEGAAFRVDFDEESWIREGDWQHFPIQQIDYTHQSQGTTIVIENPRLRTLRMRGPEVREEFGVRYSPMLEKKEVIIRVNDALCQPYRWDLYENRRHQFDFKISNDATVGGWWGLLREGSLGKYGFNLYHRGRLIRRHEKLGFTAHPDLAHLVGEIHMDPVPVTFSKREFIETSPEFEEVIERLNEPLREAISAAKEFKLGQSAELPARFLSQIESNLVALASLKDWPDLEWPFRILSVRSRSDGSFEAEIQKGEAIVKVRQRFIKGIESEPLLRSVLSDENQVTVEVNSGHPVFYITKNRALLVSWAMVEGFLLSALEPTVRSTIRSFLARRDHLVGELVKASR